MAHLEGYVSHIRFHNEENGYTVMEIETGEIFIISTKASIFVRKANM